MIIKEELERLYIQNRHTVKYIARKYDRSEEYIRQKFADYGIPMRRIDTVWRRTNKQGYVTTHKPRESHLEHRYIWEQANGVMPKGWVIHHLNGIKTDNRLENLLAVPREKHGQKVLFSMLVERIKTLEKEAKEEQLLQLRESLQTQRKT